jgi:hypothetical protein
MSNQRPYQRYSQYDKVKGAYMAFKHKAISTGKKPTIALSLQITLNYLINEAK